MTSDFHPADNIGDTCTVGELIELLGQQDPEALVVIRICLTQGRPTPDGGLEVISLKPLDCAIESEDIEPSDGILYLCTGHEIIEDQMIVW